MPYRIDCHRLVATASTPRVIQHASPNHGGVMVPQILLYHFTATTNAESPRAWFLDPASKASTQLLIDRAGNVEQFVPFNIIAWHAGKSEYKGDPERPGPEPKEGEEHVNRFAIGIELVNAGPLKKDYLNRFTACTGRLVKRDYVVFDSHGEPWHRFTPIQLEVLMNVSRLLVAYYNLTDVTGHENVSAKQDPGRVFPMAEFRRQLVKGLL